MISNKILVLRENASIDKELSFDAGTEFHIVADVVYMQGFPVPPALQTKFYSWIVDNPKLFKEIFR